MLSFSRLRGEEERIFNWILRVKGWTNLFLFPFFFPTFQFMHSPSPPCSYSRDYSIFSHSNFSPNLLISPVWRKVRFPFFFPQKRSYHPGETAPLRFPYDFDDDGNATSTSTTEPSSSGFRSSVTSRFTTDNNVTDTMRDEDTSAPGVCLKCNFSQICTIHSAQSK